MKIVLKVVEKKKKKNYKVCDLAYEQVLITWNYFWKIARVKVKRILIIMSITKKK